MIETPKAVRMYLTTWFIKYGARAAKNFINPPMRYF